MIEATIFTVLLFSHIIVLALGFYAGKQINITNEVALSKQTKPKDVKPYYDKPDIYEEERIDVS